MITKRQLLNAVMNLESDEQIRCVTYNFEPRFTRVTVELIVMPGGFDERTVEIVKPKQLAEGRRAIEG